MSAFSHYASRYAIVTQVSLLQCCPINTYNWIFPNMTLSMLKKSWRHRTWDVTSLKKGQAKVVIEKKKLRQMSCSYALIPVSLGERGKLISCHEWDEAHFTCCHVRSGDVTQDQHIWSIGGVRLVLQMSYLHLKDEEDRKLPPTRQREQMVEDEWILSGLLCMSAACRVGSLAGNKGDKRWRANSAWDCIVQGPQEKLW